MESAYQFTMRQKKQVGIQRISFVLAYKLLANQKALIYSNQHQLYVSQLGQSANQEFSVGYGP